MYRLFIGVLYDFPVVQCQGGASLASTFMLFGGLDFPQVIEKPVFVNLSTH